MTQMEQENIKLRALLAQVKQDLGPALVILSDDLRAYNQPWYTNLAYTHYQDIQTLLGGSND